MNARFLKEAQQREQELVAYSEREAIDPETGLRGILRKEWRLKMLGDPGASYEQVLAVFRRVGEWVLEHRYIRRGVDEGWRMFDTSDALDEMLTCVDDGATALHPRLLELRGEWIEARRQEQARTDQRLAEEREAAEKRMRKHRAALAFNKVRENPRQAALWSRWCAHVDFVRVDDDRQLRCMADPEFMRTGAAVYDAETQPAVVKAMKVHLAAWEEKVKQ